MLWALVSVKRFVRSYRLTSLCGLRSFQLLGRTRVSDLDFIVAKTKSNTSLIDSFISNKISEWELTLSALFEYDGKPSGAAFKDAARLILKSPPKSV